MSNETPAPRRIRLNRGLRSLAGTPDRTSLEEFLGRLLPTAPKREWTILSIEDSDPLRERMVETYQQHQRSGDLELGEPLTAAQVRDSLAEVLMGVGSGGSALIHFQDSERIGLLRINLDLLPSVAFDLLLYDRDGILISEQGGKWGVLLDRTAEESGESFELVTWGIGKRDDGL